MTSWVQDILGKQCLISYVKWTWLFVLDVQSLGNE